jgi:AraC-like DNA-binding protein
MDPLNAPAARPTRPEVDVRLTLRYPGFQVSELSYPSRFSQPTHAHETTSVTLIISGFLEELVGNQRERASACSVVVKPAGTEHRNWYGDHGARTLSFELDPDFLAVEDRGTVLRRWRWSHCGPAARMLITILRVLRVEPARSAGRIDDYFLELLGVLADEEAAIPEGPTRPKWLDAAKAELIERRSTPFRIRDTAAAFGVHPVYFTRQFRRHFGCSATGFLAQERLRTAVERVATTKDSFAEVAHGTGFSDQSHFCRQFRSTLGVTPTVYRRLASDVERLGPHPSRHYPASRRGASAAP